MTSAERERDFYKSLVELMGRRETEPLLRDAIRLLVSLTDAREVYVELRPADDERDALRYWAADGCDPARVDAIRAAISRGIIAEALATGETVLTASALEDARFRELGSVREHNIEAVLCAPIGDPVPVGVLYLQGHRGSGAKPVAFDETMIERVELFARALAPIAELLITQATAGDAPGPEEEGLPGVVARSPVMRELVNRIRLVAPLDVHVLLSGASGTGKTLLAHALHGLSERRARPLVHLNCAALPETLLENELFGAEPGAHSAVPRGGMVGKVEAAEGGTLFLDEVAELTLAAQAKLLQLLQEKTYYRLGGAKARRADVRIVAATNADLRQAIADRRFREDLFYRLRVFDVRVPSLAERPEDVAPLAHYFCNAAAERHGVSARRLSPGALRAVLAAEWPGNARELENRMESAVLNAHLRHADSVEARDVFPELAGSTDRGEELETLQQATRRFQASHVRAALETCDWNVAEAARRLDVARSHLYNLIRAHDIRRA